MTSANTGVRGAVIYTRVSTGEQAENGTSLAGQREACRRKAEALGLAVVAEREDAGVSGGFLLSRQGMQAALADIQAGRADALICANLSRFSRDAEHQHTLKREIEAAGGRVIFCDMDFDATPEGDLAFGIMGNFAAYERQVIRKRTMSGKRRRAEEGQQPQRSRPPFGYHIVTNSEVDCGLHPPEMRGRYVVDPEKAPIARRIWDLYLSGVTLSPLCRILNTEGVPTPGHGKRWLSTTVRLILMNPAHKGEPVSGRQRSRQDESRIGQRHKLTGRPITTADTRRLTPDGERLTLSAPALVSAEEWEWVQAKLTRGRADLAGSPRQIRMLSGQTYCPQCGGKAGAKQQQAGGKTYRYLTCRQRLGARDGAGQKPCVGDVYPVDTVEEAAITALRRAWESPESIAAALQVYRQSPTPADTGAGEEELKSLTAALDELKQEELRLVQAQMAGMRAGASADAYAELFGDLAARRKDMEARRQALAHDLRRQAGRPSAGKCSGAELAAFPGAALEEAWVLLSDPDVPGSAKRDVIMTLVERVICQKGGADVVFLPGVFGGPEGDGNKPGGGVTGSGNCSSGAGRVKRVTTLFRV